MTSDENYLKKGSKNRGEMVEACMILHDCKMSIYMDSFRVVVINTPKYQFISCPCFLFIEDVIRESEFQSKLSIGSKAVDELRSCNLAILVLV